MSILKFLMKVYQWCTVVFILTLGNSVHIFVPVEMANISYPIIKFIEFLMGYGKIFMIEVGVATGVNRTF